MPSVSAGPASARTSISGRLPFVLHASILIALLAASSAPTPVYSRYQAKWQLSALDITVVFSAYALALLIALLTTGTLSDHLGRRPVLMGALAVQVASMALFATAGGLSTLIGARVVQGLATGAATSAAGAALLDLESPTRPGRSALANSIAPVTGMAAGVLGATVLVRFAPAPTITLYVVLAALFAAQAAALAWTSETARPRPGGLRSMRPHLALPPAAAHALLLHGAGVVAIWALGGFYSSLGPAFTRLISPQGPQSAGGMVFFTLTAVAALTVYCTRKMRADISALLGSCAVLPAAALSLAALFLGSLVLLFTGAALAGFGFGAVSQGALRTVVGSVPAGDKGGTLASYYVLSYLAMSLPAIGAGALTTGFGLRTAALAYAGCVAALAAIAVATLSVPLRGPHRTPPHLTHYGPEAMNTASIAAGTTTHTPRARTTHNR
ncbi:MFS transporter [Streptomyces sp. SID13666]|uniref:MFS transporter n=1 Tax=unclassified Streptomyces TaxID=2593676 RepID=UPI0013C118F6|nr:MULTISPECIES: MFS transporter [unclassified Streptomyces]NEA53441.1 MFS transporter [Streptomyces sp. SID13666]NEA69235.1 MFS transporter [Streptomyces sp. SID13588]